MNESKRAELAGVRRLSLLSSIPLAGWFIAGLCTVGFIGGAAYVAGASGSASSASSRITAGGPQAAVGLYWTSDADPTVAPGVCGAPAWQLLIRTDAPGIYYKSGAACTAWTQIGTAGGSSDGITGTLTAGKIPEATGLHTVGDGPIIDTGSSLTIARGASLSGLLEAQAQIKIDGPSSTAANILTCNGSPNASITAAKGSLCMDVTAPALYQNEDGATKWGAVGGGGTTLSLGPSQAVSIASGIATISISQSSINVTPSPGADIGGIAYAGGNVDGLVVFLVDTDVAQIISLHNEDPGTTAGNRIVGPDTADESLIAGGGGAVLRYVGSGTTGRWHILAYTPHV